MQSHKEFLSTLTNTEYQTIVEKPITKEIIKITNQLAHSSDPHGQKTDTIQQYMHTVSMNAVVRVLEAYDHFLNDQSL